MLRRLTLLFALGLTVAIHAAAQTITIDAAADRAPINPLIYGVGLASEDELRGLNAPINRFGGNLSSRYNWQANAYNHGFDWYFQSISAEKVMAGDDVDRLVRATRNAASEPMVTIPMVGWVARLGPNRAKLASFSIRKYGPQQDADYQYFPDAGNGVRTNGELVTGNDPNDANLRADVFFQQAWVSHLLTTWGDSSRGGIRYYVMDNEPSLWHETHRDIHPNGQTLEELRDKIVDYAQMVKSIDPGAIVTGPEEWGWLGYRFSGADLQYAIRNNWNGIYPDRLAHGDIDQLPWLLTELARTEGRIGKRLLDVCTVHIYPQSGEFSDNVSPAVQRLRNRSTRSLWDRSYRDESWIGERIYLIPRMREWVSERYPGTLTGITEYNWGAENHINGATTQADILGIFGRERLDLANRYATPAVTTPTYKAIQMYRNYDGSRSMFGDVSVRTAASAPDVLSAFAAIRTRDGALTIMLINKETQAVSPLILVSNFRARETVEVWQLTASNRIERKNDLRLTASRITQTLPAQSVTLLIVKPSPRSRPIRR